MLAVMLPKLTAPSSTWPKCPTVKILATVSDCCSRNVTISGTEYLPSTFASRCHVVWMIPAATASSHFLLMASDPSWPPYGNSGSPSNGVSSDGSSKPSCTAPFAASSSSGLTTFLSPPGIPATGNALTTLAAILCSALCGCLGGMTLLSLSKLLSSLKASCLSLHVGFRSGPTTSGMAVARVPAVIKLGLR